MVPVDDVAQDISVCDHYALAQYQTCARDQWMPNDDHAKRLITQTKPDRHPNQTWLSLKPNEDGTLDARGRATRRTER